MKKICFVTTIPGTIRAFLVGFSNYLVEKENYDVTFICDNGELVYQYCTDKIHYIPVSMKRGVNLEAFRVINELTEIFKKEQFDIVQYSTPNAAFYASIAAKRAGIPNRLYCQWGIRYMGYEGGIKRAVFKYIEKKTCSSSTIIESESFSLYKFSIKEGLYPESKASVIGTGSACGVDLTRYNYTKREEYRKEKRNELHIPQDAFVFGFTGRLTRDKGINELIAAFKSLNTCNAYLLLVGDYDNEETLDPMLLQWAKMEKNIIFTGRKSNVEEYYCALDVFVSLSYREGFGIVVIEAAAMGVPAIVTDVPGQSDTIIPNETGISVPAKNVEKVVEVYKYCIQNPNKLKEMGVAARINVEKNYEQQQLFEELAKHRNQIIASSKR